MKLNMLIATPLAIAFGLTVGWSLPAVVEHFGRSDQPAVGFTDQQAGDVAWQCRVSHGIPSYGLHKGPLTSFGTVTCKPGGGKPTSDEAYREAVRQEALSDRRDQEIRMRERAERNR